MFQAITTIKNVVQSILAVLISATLVVLVALAVWQVFTRYVLQTPALFTEETLRFAMIWMGLIGSAYAFGVKGHLSLGLVVDAMSGWKRMALIVFNDLVVLYFAYFVLFKGGMRAVESSMNQFSPILRLPMGQVYYILPITAVLIILIQGIDLILEFQGQKDVAPDNGSSDS